MQNTGLSTTQQDAIYDWVSAAVNDSSVNIVWGFPDEVIEEKPLIVLTIVQQPQPESHPTTHYVNSTTFAKKFHHSFKLSVTVYDNDGSNIARRINMSQYWTSTIENLQKVGIVCRTSRRGFATPRLNKAEYEYREAIEFAMAFGEMFNENLTTIDTASVTGVIKGRRDGNDKIVNIPID